MLKHMLNLAEQWELRQGVNPVRLVKALPEDNLQFQTLSEAEESARLEHCPSYLQDMIVFATNTGLRSGDIFDLQWKGVDLENQKLTIVMQKNRKPLTLPLNERAMAVLRAWEGLKRGPTFSTIPLPATVSAT